MTRSKSVEVAEIGEDRFRFVARLTDQGQHANHTSDDPAGTTVTIHDFGVEGECEGPDLTVLSLEVEAFTHPYADCPFVLPAATQLVGQSLMSGWRRAVLGQGTGTAGCTHVNTLLLGLAELAPMVFFLRINKAVPQTRQTLGDGRWTVEALRVAPRLADVCHGLREGGTALTVAEERLDNPTD